MKSKILIVEDDRDIALIERDYLELGGYEVTTVADGYEGMKEILSGKYHLALLDIMLPGIDGLEICKKVRSETDIPIMLVTAKRTDIDKIRGLGMGADAYIEKPFSPGVLVARVRSQIAQYERLKGKLQKKSQRLDMSGISLEHDSHRVYANGKEIVLPLKEFQLLEFLMMHHDIVYSKEALYTRIWGMDAFGSTATVPVHINRLREALEKNPANPEHIITVWGAGYKFQS